MSNAQEHLKQRCEKVSMQWSALLDALGELVDASHDEGTESADHEEGKLDGQPADVERAPAPKWLGRCDSPAHLPRATLNVPLPTSAGS